MILRNQAMCPDCGDHVASFNVHDYRSCKCGNISVDGGVDYLRRLFKGKRPIETSVSIPVEIPYREAASYLGLLAAFEHRNGPGRHILSTRTLCECSAEQAVSKPWFRACSQRLIVGRLRQLEAWGHVEEVHVPGLGFKWRSKVELAPWRA